MVSASQRLFSKIEQTKQSRIDTPTVSAKAETLIQKASGQSSGGVQITKYSRGGSGSSGSSQPMSTIITPTESAKPQQIVVRTEEPKANTLTQQLQAKPNQISGVDSPGGINLGKGASKPIGLYAKEVLGNTQSFFRGERSFADIFPETKRGKTPKNIQPQPLFIPGGSGTIIPGFEGFGSGQGGLSLGEYKLKRGQQAGEFPEFVNIVGKGEVRLGGILGVPTQAVEQSIIEKQSKILQNQINAGTVNLGEDLSEPDFQKAAQDVLRVRTEKDLLQLGITRPNPDLFLPSKAVGNIAELGVIGLGSTTPIGGAIVGASLISRGEKNLGKGILGTDLTFGQRATSIGLGVLDIGFGTAIGGASVTQELGGLLSNQAIRESQRGLSGIKFENFQGEVLGKTPTSALIETTTLKQFGSSTQEIKSILPIFKIGENQVAITGGRAKSVTKIFDPISGKTIVSDETFSLGSFGPLNIGRGGSIVSKSPYGIFEFTTPELQSLVSVGGKGFVKPKGSDSFKLIDIASTSQKGEGGFNVFTIRPTTEKLNVKSLGVDLTKNSFDVSFSRRLGGEFSGTGFIKDLPQTNIESSGIKVLVGGGKKTPFSTTFGQQLQTLSFSELSSGTGAGQKLVTSIKTPQVKIDNNLVGIPRMIGGAGLTSEQIYRQTSTNQIQFQIPQSTSKSDFGFFQSPSLGLDISTKSSQTSSLGVNQKSLSRQKQISLPKQSQLFKTNLTTKRLYQELPAFDLFSKLDVGPKTRFSQRDPFSFRGLDLNFPSLGGGGAPPLYRREPFSRSRIAPSFTAIAFNIETGLPKESAIFGISPFDIRGLPTKKKKKKRK